MTSGSGSAVADVITSRLRISDPRPSRCAACFQGGQASVRFVDFDAAIDRGTIVDDQNAVLDGIDDLHLCESCVRAAADVLALKPAVQAGQAREIRRLELSNDRWRQYAHDLEATLQTRPEPGPGAMRRPTKA